MPKIIRTLRSCSMKIFCKFPTINISKRYYWLVICIAKNLIWTTLKVIFSIFRFLPDFPIVISRSNPNKKYINATLIYAAFRWCINLKFLKNWPLWLVPLFRVTCTKILSQQDHKSMKWLTWWQTASGFSIRAVKFRLQLAARQTATLQNQPHVSVKQTEIPAHSAGLVHAALVQQLRHQSGQSLALVSRQHAVVLGRRQPGHAQVHRVVQSRHSGEGELLEEALEGVVGQGRGSEQTLALQSRVKHQPADTTLPLTLLQRGETRDRERRIPPGQPVTRQTQQQTALLQMNQLRITLQRLLSGTTRRQRSWGVSSFLLRIQSLLLPKTLLFILIFHCKITSNTKQNIIIITNCY